ncbi:MAG: hypothetical protein CME32_06330 [Gimesia sp.]|nr:hypothetical protein [Gimesia sp.]
MCDLLDYSISDLEFHSKIDIDELRELRSTKGKLTKSQLISLSEALETPPSSILDEPLATLESAAIARTVKSQSDTSPIAGPLKVYIDSDAYTPEEKGELLSLLSELYSINTDDSLVIDDKGKASAIIAEVVSPNGGES